MRRLHTRSMTLDQRVTALADGTLRGRQRKAVEALLAERPELLASASGPSVTGSSRHSSSGVHFRGRAAALLRRLCATASAHRDSALDRRGAPVQCESGSAGCRRPITDVARSPDSPDARRIRIFIARGNPAKAIPAALARRLSGRDRRPERASQRPPAAAWGAISKVTVTTPGL